MDTDNKTAVVAVGAKKGKFETVITPEFRVSWPQVFEAKAVNPGDRLKFSVKMLFRLKPNPKDATEKVLDAAALTPLKEAIKTVKEN